MKVSGRLIAQSTFLFSAVITACIAFTSPSEKPPEAPPILIAYKDSGGIWTLCDGVTFIQGRRVKQGDTATLELCTILENEAHAEAVRAVGRLITVELPLESFLAFEDLAYNAGAGTLAGSTMRRMANAGDLRGACLQFPRFKYAYAERGDVRDMRDGVRDGKALCTIRANQCYGVIVRRQEQMAQCLKGVK